MKNRLRSISIIGSLGLLDTLTPFSIDLYLPAFNAIASDLHTQVQRLSLSISVYFIGYALGQICYGPLFDRFGRKKPLYFGLLVYFIATFGCMKASSIEMLLLFRFIAALGGSAASVGSMSMVRDFFPAKDAAKIFSMLMLVLSVSPLVAPSVGGLMVTTLGWRSLFGVLLGLALLDAILVAFVLPEVYAPDPSVSLRLKPILRNFRDILRLPRFWIYTVAGSFSFSGLFVYVAGAPGIFMNTFQVSPRHFGIIFGALAMGMIGGGQFNHLLVRKFSNVQVFRSTIYVQNFLCLLFLVASFTGIGLAPTLAFLFCILLCTGITYPNAAAIALQPFTKNIGSASALLGFLQLGIGALVAGLIGLVTLKGTVPTALAMTLSAGVSGLILLLGREEEAPGVGSAH